MPTRAGRKFIFLGLLLLFAVVFSLPSLVKTLPGWRTKILPTEGMRLGLDLRGRMYLTLKVDLPRAIENQLDLSMADLRETLRRRHEEYGPTETVGPSLGQDSIRDGIASAIFGGILVVAFMSIY